MNKSGQQMATDPQRGVGTRLIGIIPSVWLIVSPWLLGFAATNSTLTGNDVIGGIVLLGLVLLNLTRLSRGRRLGVMGIILLSGIWLCIAGVLSSNGDSAAFWSNLVSGIVIVLLAASQLARSISS